MPNTDKNLISMLIVTNLVIKTAISNECFEAILVQNVTFWTTNIWKFFEGNIFAAETASYNKPKLRSLRKLWKLQVCKSLFEVHMGPFEAISSPSITAPFSTLIKGSDSLSFAYNHHFFGNTKGLKRINRVIDKGSNGFKWQPETTVQNLHWPSAGSEWCKNKNRLPFQL